MKKVINFFKKLRFFFRVKLTIVNFSPELQTKLKKLAKNAGLQSNKFVFRRTFNNHCFFPTIQKFEFIGFYPVFACTEIMHCYFSESNEID